MSTVRPGRRGPGRLAAAAIALLTAVLGTALAVTPATPASADAFGGCYGLESSQGCVPDNFNHWYCFSGTVNSNIRTAFINAMVNLDTQTSYADFAESAGCNNVTDLVVVQDTSLGARGQYACEGFNINNHCEQATLRFNPNNLPTANDRTKTACHEIGHSVGLKHGIVSGPNADNAFPAYNDCMWSGSIPSGLDFDGYNAHHVAHINARA